MRGSPRGTRRRSGSLAPSRASSRAVSVRARLGVDRVGDGSMRREPRQDEGDPVARRDGELGDGRHVLAVARRRVTAGTAHPVPRSPTTRVVDRADPRHDPPEVEPDHQLRPHRAPRPTDPRRSGRCPGASPRGGMKSIARTEPESVSYDRSPGSGCRCGTGASAAGPAPRERSAIGRARVRRAARRSRHPSRTAGSSTSRSSPSRPTQRRGLQVADQSRSPRCSGTEEA